MSYSTGPSGATESGAPRGPGASGSAGRLTSREHLDRIVGGYILGDLASLAALPDEIKNRKMGALCFPMVMPVLAGSELLGRLLGKSPGRRSAGIGRR